jgi:hypothetical protein
MACARVRAGASQKRASSTPRISPDSGIHGFIILDPIEYVVRICVEVVGVSCQKSRNAQMR